MEIRIYTAQEEGFLEKVLDVFEVSYSREKVKDTISYTLYKIKADVKQREIIEHCMMYNYKRNFG